MKSIILLTVFLVLPVFNGLAQDNNKLKNDVVQSPSCMLGSGIRFEIIRQRKVEGLSDNPLANREVEFRLTNTSNCKIFIKGSQGQDFFPVGFFAEFDQKKRKWVSSFENDPIPEFKIYIFSLGTISK